jgi:hypothetical protein
VSDAHDDARPARLGGPVSPGQVITAIGVVFLAGAVVGFILGRTL